MAKKILLADDSVTIQKVVEITFKDEDYDVSIVGNGLDALKKVKEDRPDIILADISMPGLNGIDLCEKLKGDPEHKDIPIILLTNSFEEFDKKKGDKIGVNGYIEKPFESQDLVDMVESLTIEQEKEEKEEGEDLVSIDEEKDDALETEVEKENEEEAKKELGLELIDEEEKEEEITAKEAQVKEGLSDELDDITEISEEEIGLEEIKKEDKKTPPEEVQEELQEEEIPPKKKEKKEEPYQEDILALEAEAEEEEVKETVSEAPADLEEDLEEFEKFEPEEQRIEAGEERKAAKTDSAEELDQVLGRHLRNIIEESFKRSMDRMTPKINEVLEKVTREIVSEIAESIIKKEIEKLKGGSND